MSAAGVGADGGNSGGQGNAGRGVFGYRGPYRPERCAGMGIGVEVGGGGELT